MNKIFLSILIIIGGCSLNDSNVNKTKLPNIPLEDFFRNPEKSSFQLSPNGKYISYMKPWEDGNRRMNVYVKPIDSDKEIRLTKASKRSLYGYFWLNDNRIAYIQDKGGDENIHIYAVNLDGSNDIDLTPFDNIQARITDDLEEDED
jgi:Tol biopolymer transport system component